MIAKILIFLVLAATAAIANSIGWPRKDTLPDWLSVEIDIPPRWGSPDSFNLYGVVRVTLTNRRADDLHMLNMHFRDPRFLAIKEDGTEEPLPIVIGKLRTPQSNPGITLNPHSAIGFEIEMDRPEMAASAFRGRIVFEITIAFVAGQIGERREADGHVSPNVGSLDGFEYVVVRRVLNAERLLSQ